MLRFELFDETEKKHIKDVMASGILVRCSYGHRKAKELEGEIARKMFQ